MNAPPCDASLLGLVPCLSGKPARWIVLASVAGNMRAQFFCDDHKPNLLWSAAQMQRCWYDDCLVE